MHHHFHDVISRIDEPPVWWDVHGYPRYDEFGPNETHNIYADEVCLLRITCQDCGTPYDVAFSSTKYDAYEGAERYLSIAGDPAKEGRRPTAEEVAVEMKNWTLETAIKTRKIHYGDPPNNCSAEGCVAGATMNSVPRQVLQYWSRHSGEVAENEHGVRVVVDPVDYMQWKRDPSLEIEVLPDWYEVEA